MRTIKTDVYFNLTRKIFSLRVQNKVIDHRGSVLITSPEFVVREAGRQRVLKTGQKNVHAFVRGRQMEPGRLIDRLPKEWRKARYNPKTLSTFVDAETGEPLYRASLARMSIVDKKPVVEYYNFN